MESLKGHLLIADPSLRDPNFTRTVSLILQHNEQGALGLILNRPTRMSVRDVAEQVFGHAIDWNKPIMLGGPVEGPAFMLHTVADRADEEVLPGLYSSLEADKLRALLADRSEPSIVIANHSGWGPGQLEAEIAEGSWLWIEATLERVFREPHESSWKDFVVRVRGQRLADLLNLPGMPDDPTVN